MMNLRDHNAGVISRHDAYLTASPYDDDYPELEAECPKCKSEAYEIWEFDPETETFDLICDDCGHKYLFGGFAVTDEQEDQRVSLSNEVFELRHARVLKEGLTTEKFFECAEDDGEPFIWDDSEAGDWHVYCCEEKDCPIQWHRVAYGINMGRDEDGNRRVECWNVDSDGDSNTDHMWDEKEGDKPDDETWKWLSKSLANQSDDFFLGWTEYWLECAVTGKDPAEQCMKTIPNEKWFDFCLDAVKDNIKYYKMGK